MFIILVLDKSQFFINIKISKLTFLKLKVLNFNSTINKNLI